MNTILRRTLIPVFVIVFGGAYMSTVTWAYGIYEAESKQNRYESNGYIIQTKAGMESEESGAAKDPVCNMEVSNIKKAPSEEHNGETYYFCSEQCKKTFKKDPDSYTQTETTPQRKSGGY